MKVVVATSSCIIIDQQNLGTFSDDVCSSTTVFIFLHIAPIDCFFWTSFRFFFFRLSYLLTRFLSVLTLELSAIYQLTCFRGRFRVSGCFLHFLGCCECWLRWKIRVMCHTRQEYKLWERYLRKYFLCVQGIRQILVIRFPSN